MRHCGRSAQLDQQGRLPFDQPPEIDRAAFARRIDLIIRHDGDIAPGFVERRCLRQDAIIGVGAGRRQGARGGIEADQRQGGTGCETLIAGRQIGAFEIGRHPQRPSGEMAMPSGDMPVLARPARK
jgi:hypothetical protein